MSKILKIFWIFCLIILEKVFYMIDERVRKIQYLQLIGNYNLAVLIEMKIKEKEIALRP